jgi:hypothetical protein
MQTKLWFVALALTAPFAVAAPKKKVVLVDAPAAVSKVLLKAVGRTVQTKVLKPSLGDTPTGKGVRDACRPNGASAVLLARPQGALVSVMVLTCADGSPIDSIVLKAKGLKAVPPRDTKTLLAAISSGRPAGAGSSAVGGETTDAPAITEDTGVEEAPAKAASNKKSPYATEPTEAPEPTKSAASKAAASSSSDTSSSSSRVDDEPSVRESAKKDDADLPTDGLPAFIAHIGFRAFGRTLNWANRATDEPIAFANGFIGAPAADLTWYPASKLTTSFARHIGIIGLVDASLGSPTRERTSGQAFTTTATRWRIGAAVRFPFASRFEAGATLGVQGHSFIFSPSSTPLGLERGPLPSVSYFGPRVGARLSLTIAGPLAIEGFGGLTFLTSLGEVASMGFFPQARGIGFDAGAAIRLRFEGGFSAFAAFDWQRYNLTLNAMPDARLVATAAGDNFLAGTVGVGFAL